MPFYIEKITATGSGKTPATVEFVKGLNIICGVSDAGKTCVVKCIRFIFGGDKPFEKDETGYTEVSMVIVTQDEKRITFTRKIGKNVVDVISEVSEIDSRDYDVDYKTKGNKRPVLNSVWLTLMGITGEPEVIKNQYFVRNRFTWNMLSSLYHITETNIENPKSAILPVQATTQPYFLSCLLYLITGEAFENESAKEREEVSAAKRNAVHDFANAQIAALTRRKDALDEELRAFDGLDVESQMQQCIDDLAETEERLSDATEESHELLSTLVELREREAEYSMTFTQFEALKSQYMSDIKRLTFVVEGEQKRRDLPERTKCPFCDGAIQPRKKVSYVNASKAELARIMAQLQGLTASASDIETDLGGVRSEIARIEKRCAEINTLINEDLSPHAERLKESIKAFRAYIQIQQGLALLKEISGELNEGLRKNDAEQEDTLRFHPKAHYPDDFGEKMDEYAQSILESCQYEGLNTAHFDLGTFDLEINGHKKESSHGKGHWAFINTALALTFRQYLNCHAKYNPGLLMIDTPLLGLDQGVEDTAPASMKTALFQYLIDHQDEGQLIVVENTNEMPDLDYCASGAKVIEFNHNKYQSKYESRYGFLYGVYSKKDNE